jgi:hypothetical protein
MCGMGAIRCIRGGSIGPGWGEDLEVTINDCIFDNMRISGTKYETMDALPPDAIPVSAFYRKYGKKFGVSSPAYTYVKYDRHKFGYTTNAGTRLKTEYPGYDIIDFYGTCYVINYH